MKKVLITGGAGFGASALIPLLLERDWKVTVVDIVHPLDAWRLEKDLPRIEYKWKAIHDLTPHDLDGQDVVVHFAACPDVQLGINSPQWVTFQNIVGTVALLEACRQVGIDRLLNASSGNEWGRPIRLPISEDHPLTPHNWYANAKAAQELAFWTAYRSYDLPIIIMSNGCVVGPKMRRSIFIYIWLYNILHDKPVILEGEGDQTRDITYGSDVADAWLRAIEAPKEKVIGEKFQVSYGEEHSIRELLEWCFEVAGKRTQVIKLPYRPGEQGQRECFSNEKARRVLVYNPRVPPKLAIKYTWEWVCSLLEMEKVHPL